ncbi:MAG: FAD-binding protein, partial [Clostridia bacterium]
EDIVTYQSLAVDAISGATNTSKAIVAAVVEALTAAGGDVSTLYTPIEKEVAVAGDLIRKDVDVVVVGAGGAGLAAAVTVVENGGSVLVIDKMPVT